MTARDSERCVGDRLDEAMRRAGYPSQAALGRAAGVSQPTINRILKSVVGKRGPETETLKRLAQACGVTFTWLNEGRDDAASPCQSMTKVQLDWLRLLDDLCSADVVEFTELIKLRQSRNRALIAELRPDRRE